MSDFTIYEDITGKIISTGSGCSVEGLLSVYDRCSVLHERSDLNTQYVYKGKVTDRLHQDIIVSDTTLKNIVVGSSVYIDGELQGVCITGEIEIDKESSEDVYKLKLVCFPYLDYEVTL